MPVDAGDAEATIAEFARAGINDDALAADLQREGAEVFAQSWRGLMDRIASKGKVPLNADQLCSTAYRAF